MDRLSGVAVPTEVIWGTKDRLIPVEIGRRFAEEIPVARLHLMEGAGHAPQVSHPREFQRILLGVLGGAPGGGAPGMLV